MWDVTAINKGASNREARFQENFGSSENFLSFRANNETLASNYAHYSADQAFFSQQTSRFLSWFIEAHPPEKIFNLDLLCASKFEMMKMEQLYQEITQNRATLSPEPNSPKICYQSPYQQRPTETFFFHSTIDGRFTRYTQINDSQTPLTLGHIVTCLDTLPNEVPDCFAHFDLTKIVLGQLLKNNQGACHQMGNYRKNRHHIYMVDYYTAIAAKKTYRAFTQENIDKAIKYAFVFATLRGYNVRSVIGACWAQEISFRWLLGFMNLKQPRKTPGVSLDVEACLIGTSKEVGSEQIFQNIIKKMVDDYKMSVGMDASSNELVQHDLVNKYRFFERPVPVSSAGLSAVPA